MSEEIIIEQQDPIVVEIITTPVVIEVTPETATEITVAEPGESLAMHMIHDGIGGHIPTGGISQSMVTGLQAELLEIRSLIETGNEGGNPFLTNTIADLNSPVYYYYGGNRGEQWQINRFAKSDLTKTVATQLANSAYTTFAEAWEVRSTLIYIAG